MKRWIKAITGGLVLCLLFQVCGFAGSSEGIRQRVVRLHVLAHSDSAEEQALKLQVRDAVSAEATVLLRGVQGREEVLVRLEEVLPQLQAVAQQCVTDAGYTHEVTAELAKTYFTTRVYEGGTYPAGVYDALRLTIGDGAGRNWWCVLYPPLCVSAAMEAPTAEEVLTDGQRAVVQTPSYAVRFKLVEWWEALVHRQ